MVGSATRSGNRKQAIVDAPPPWHSIAFILSITALSLHLLPSQEEYEKLATVEVFTRSRFPELLSVQQIACIRLMLGVAMVADVVNAFLHSSWNQRTYYNPHSKLQIVKSLRFRGALLRSEGGTIHTGLLCIAPFTAWCFLIEGIAFVLAGYISLAALHGLRISKMALVTAILAWHIAAPMSMLVSAVVKYILWPEALRNECVENLATLKKRSALTEHNLNVIASLVELGILGGLPIRFEFIAVTPLFGIFYLFFAWWMRFQWCDRKFGPQFLYSFLDTTLGFRTTLSFGLLLLVLLASFATFAATERLVERLGGSIWTSVGWVAILCKIVCRFRD